MGGATQIEVDSNGTAATMVLSGAISNTGALIKSGAGDLQFSNASTTANTYSGGTTVNEGVLTLSANGGAGTGSVTIGNGAGGQFTDDNLSNGIIAAAVVKLGSVASSQFAAGASITIGNTGLLDLSGSSAQNFVTNVVMNVGEAAGAAVKTGGSAVLSFSGSFTVNSFGATDGAAPAATVTGNLNLHSSSPTFTVNNTLLPSTFNAQNVSSHPQLVINGAITTDATPGTVTFTTPAVTGNLPGIPATIELVGGTDSYSQATAINNATLYLSSGAMNFTRRA